MSIFNMKIFLVYQLWLYKYHAFIMVYFEFITFSGSILFCDPSLDHKRVFLESLLFTRNSVSHPFKTSRAQLTKVGSIKKDFYVFHRLTTMMSFFPLIITLRFICSQKNMSFFQIIPLWFICPHIKYVLFFSKLFLYIHKKNSFVIHLYL